MSARVKLTLADDSVMAWFPYKPLDGSRDSYIYDVDSETAERWLRIQKEWEDMQHEIEKEVMGANS